MITFIYIKSGNYYIGSEFLDYNLKNINYYEELIGDRYINNLFEITNFNYLKIVNIDNEKIFTCILKIMKFFIMLKK